MQIKLWTATNSVTVTSADPKFGYDILEEIDEPIETLNKAVDGTVYHYYDASIGSFEVPLNWLTETQKDTLIAMRKEGIDVSFQVNSETAITVRIIEMMRFTRTVVNGETVYNTQLKLVKV